MIGKGKNVLKGILLNAVLIGFFISFESCNDGEENLKILVSSISIKGDFIEDGGTSQLTADVFPEDATNKVVEWSVSNEDIATIDQNGLLTGVSDGIVTVKASATDGSGVIATKSIGVSGFNPSEILVESISIIGDDISDGEPQQLSAEVLPANADNKEVVWAVSDPEIATIDQSGLLQPVKSGTVDVTATAVDGSGVKATRTFNVQILVKTISVIGTDITDGKTQQLSVEVLPENATNKTVTWSVSDTDIASIDQSGLLAPGKNGTVEVMATANDGSGVFGTLTINISGVADVGDGTIVNTEEDIISALASATAGDFIYVRSGNYSFSSSIRMSANGQEGNMISFLVYPGDERPVFDFSSMSENSSNRAVILSGDYWHIKGIEIYKAGDNGMHISGSNNLIEYCAFYENADSGLQIGNGGANNTVLNCDSYFNADSSLENADGFAAKLDCGTGNKFIGCRAWNNLDDGWDGYLRGTDNITTTYVNCWAFRNGYLKDGSLGVGDGNGFKTGGSDDKALKHNAIYTNCIAAGNSVDGFDHNSNRGSITIYNSSAHVNGSNINFGSTNAAANLEIKNTLSFGGNSSDKFEADLKDISNNSWQDGLGASSDDFVSINIDLLLSPRNEDGSLPDIDYLYLKSNSDLIDKGIDVGLPYNGTAPDLGAFEYGN